MVVTILVAEVAPEKEAVLQAEYKQALEHLTAGITETFLLQDSNNPRVWRIVTVWESREALEAMRATGIPPRGPLMFRAAGAEPTLVDLNVIAHAQAVI